MALAQFYGHNKFSKLVPSDFWLYEFSVWLHVIAESLVGVFIPILLLTIGFTVGEVVIYYVLYNLLDVPFNFLARYLVQVLGARWVLAIGTFFAILFFGTFSLLETGQWGVLILMALFAALYDAFYWVAHVYLFMNSSKGDDDAGKNTGIMYIVSTVGEVIAPVVGAAILIFGDKDMLFYFSIAIFMLSLAPLPWVDDFEDKPLKALIPFKDFFASIEDKKNYITTTLFSIHGSAEGVIWPMFIFMLFETIESVALIPVIVSISTIVFTYFASGIKTANREKIVLIGAFLIGVVWLGRMFLESTFFYSLSILLVGFFALLITIPVDSNLFTRGNITDPLQAATYRNTFHMFGKFVFYLILAILLNTFNISFVLAMFCMMAIVAVNYGFIYVISKKDNTLLQQP